MIEITQGESFPIYIDLTQDGAILLPEMIVDLKVCLGSFHGTYSGGRVGFDDQTLQWWIQPTAEETMAMEPGTEDICAHIKYSGGNQLTVRLGKARINESCCGEVW